MGGDCGPGSWALSASNFESRAITAKAAPSSSRQELDEPQILRLARGNAHENIARSRRLLPVRPGQVRDARTGANGVRIVAIFVVEKRKPLTTPPL
jgi:hypothetical protein